MKNRRPIKGFHTLKPEEIIILRAFKYDWITWPVDCGLDEPTINKVINNLRKKNILHKGNPLRLTKRGIRIRDNYI